MRDGKEKRKVANIMQHNVDSWLANQSLVCLVLSILSLRCYLLGPIRCCLLGPWFATESMSPHSRYEHPWMLPAGSPGYQSQPAWVKEMLAGSRGRHTSNDKYLYSGLSIPDPACASVADEHMDN